MKRGGRIRGAAGSKRPARLSGQVDPGHETRTRILDVAEELFAESGFHGTSLRAVTTRASANLAAVNYHFGSKEGLLRAVLQRHIGPVNQARLARLDELEREAGSRPIELEALVRVFVEAPLRHFLGLGRHGRVVMRFLGRSQTEPHELVQAIVAEHFTEVARRFHSALCRTLPDLPPAELAWRLRALIGVFSFFLCSADPDSGAAACPPGLPMPEPRDIDATLHRIVAFAVPGLEAPLSGIVGPCGP